MADEPPEGPVNKDNVSKDGKLLEKGHGKSSEKQDTHERPEEKTKDKAQANRQSKNKDIIGKDKEKNKEKQGGSQRASLTKSHGNVPMGIGQQPKPVLRFMPTYRLEPKNPLNKERIEIIMKHVMNKTFNDNYAFHPRQSLHMAAQVSEEIKNSIKTLNFDRYRYIVVLTIGEQLMQGYYSMINFLWDATKDGFVTYTVETPTYFAVCSVFYIYYD